MANSAVSVVSKVASTGTEFGSTLFAANPAQNCVDEGGRAEDRSYAGGQWIDGEEVPHRRWS